MTRRVDSASKTIQASPLEIFQAFADPTAVEQWLPPLGMVGKVLDFDFREGGGYGIRLTYVAPQTHHGKTTDDSDEVHVRLTRISEGRKIEQEVAFESEDPSFAGIMRMVWTFEADGEGTSVTVRAENVPPGIRQEDHVAGMNATLTNLDAFLTTRNR